MIEKSEEEEDGDVRKKTRNKIWRKYKKQKRKEGGKKV